MVYGAENGGFIINSKEEQNLNDFREWLSDNLRYIGLIFGILVILTGLFFGVRALSGSLNGKKASNSYESDSIVTSTGTKSAAAKNSTAAVDSVNTSDAGLSADTASADASLNTESKDGTASAAVTETPVPTVTGGTLSVNAVPAVTNLINTYYTDLQNQDVAGIKAIADALPDDQAAKIATAVTKYSDIAVYTKQGPEGDGTSYVVYAYYKYLNPGQKIAFPGLTQMLVRKDDSGTYKIVYSEYDQATSDYIDSLASQDDVKALVERVKTEYDSAKAEEESAAGTSSAAESVQTGSAETQRTAVISSACNLRTGPGYDYPVVEELVGGTSVTVIGDLDGGWYHIKTDTSEGYVGGRFIS